VDCGRYRLSVKLSAVHWRIEPKVRSHEVALKDAAEGRDSLLHGDYPDRRDPSLDARHPYMGHVHIYRRGSYNCLLGKMSELPDAVRNPAGNEYSATKR
jgi:hypothetical protein